MIKLFLYRKNNAWVFDDQNKGIKAEPFVLGSSEIIDRVSKTFLGRSPKSISFSEGDKLDFTLERLQMEGKWTRYRLLEDSDMIGWLCPVLYKYFNYPPKLINFTLN